MLGIADPESPYVKLFTVSTPEWALLPWHAKLIYPALLRQLLPDGSLPLNGEAPAVVVARVTGVPVEFVMKALPFFLNPKCPWAEVVDGNLYLLNYELTLPVEVAERPFGKSPAAMRMRRLRAQRKAEKVEKERLRKETCTANAANMFANTCERVTNSSRTCSLDHKPLARAFGSWEGNYLAANEPRSIVSDRSSQSALGVLPSLVPTSSPRSSKEEIVRSGLLAPLDKPAASQAGRRIGENNFVSGHENNPEAEWRLTSPPNEPPEKTGPTSEEMESIANELTAAIRRINPRARGPKLSTRHSQAIQRTWDTDPKRYARNPGEFMDDWRAAIWAQYENVRKNPKELMDFLSFKTLCRPDNFCHKVDMGHSKEAVADLRRPEVPREMRIAVREFGAGADDFSCRRDRFDAYLTDIYKRTPSPHTQIALANEHLATWCGKLDSIPSQKRTIKQEIELLRSILPEDLAIFEENLQKTELLAPGTLSRGGQLAVAFLERLKFPSETKGAS